MPVCSVVGTQRLVCAGRAAELRGDGCWWEQAWAAVAGVDLVRDLHSEG